jgi:hypothetical protein
MAIGDLVRVLAAMSPLYTGGMALNAPEASDEANQAGWCGVR